jgi:hypothetical protein
MRWHGMTRHGIRGRAFGAGWLSRSRWYGREEASVSHSVADSASVSTLRGLNQRKMKMSYKSRD